MKAIVLFLAIASMSVLQAKEAPPPLLSVGGGYFDGGEHHSGGVYQLEYKFGSYCFWAIRPQVVALTADFRSVFVGLGLGAEFYFTKNIFFIPSFTPGAYFKGRGKDLGYSFEFRSAFEIAYQFNNCVRVGGEVFHISNASISRRNPGANALIFFVAIPLSCLTQR